MSNPFPDTPLIHAVLRVLCPGFLHILQLFPVRQQRFYLCLPQFGQNVSSGDIFVPQFLQNLARGAAGVSPGAALLGAAIVSEAGDAILCAGGAAFLGTGWVFPCVGGVFLCTGGVFLCAGGTGLEAGFLCGAGPGVLIPAFCSNFGVFSFPPSFLLILITFLHRSTLKRLNS